jgi:hypothetical protein
MRRINRVGFDFKGHMCNLSLLADSSFQDFNGHSALIVISATVSLKGCTFLENTANAGDEAVLKVGFSAQARAEGCLFVRNTGFAVETDSFNSYFFSDLRTDQLNAPARSIGSLLPLSAGQSGSTDDADFPFLQLDDPVWLLIRQVRAYKLRMLEVCPSSQQPIPCISSHVPLLMHVAWQPLSRLTKCFWEEEIICRTVFRFCLWNASSSLCRKLQLESGEKVE